MISTRIEKNKENEVLLSNWLKDNHLGTCVPFEAKITSKACSALKASYAQRLDKFDYPDDVYKEKMECCVNNCNGIL